MHGELWGEWHRLGTIDARAWPLIAHRPSKGLPRVDLDTSSPYNKSRAADPRSEPASRADRTILTGRSYGLRFVHAGCDRYSATERGIDHSDHTLVLFPKRVGLVVQSPLGDPPSCFPVGVGPAMHHALYLSLYVIPVFRL